MRFSLLPLLLVGVLATATPAGPSRAGNIVTMGGGFDFNVGVTSIREARFRNVIRQEYDFSCGSASVALTNVGETPLFVEAAGQALAGSSLDDAAVAAAVDAAKAAIKR